MGWLPLAIANHLVIARLAIRSPPLEVGTRPVIASHRIASLAIHDVLPAIASVTASPAAIAARVVSVMAGSASTPDRPASAAAARR